MITELPLPLLHQTIKATSPLGDPRVTYNLEEGQVPETNMPVRFYIKPNRVDGSASILVAENLDYETTRFFMLRVRVQNVAAVPLASFTTVYVNVTGKLTFTSPSPSSFLFFFIIVINSCSYTSEIQTGRSAPPPFADDSFPQSACAGGGEEPGGESSSTFPTNQHPML